MTKSPAQRLTDLIIELRAFRFCGPSDDPDEQTSVASSYYYLLAQLRGLANRFLPATEVARLNAINVDISDIMSAYVARAEVDAILPLIEEALQSSDANSPTAGRRLAHQDADESRGAAGSPPSMSMASSQAHGDSSSISDADALAAQIFDALDADVPDCLRALIRQASVLITSELCGLLDDQGKCDFNIAKNYCERWDREGPPRPSFPRDPTPAKKDYDPFERMGQNDYDPFDLGRKVVRRSSPMPPQPMWDADETQRWRGRLRASLKPLAGHQSGRGDREQPSPMNPRPASPPAPPELPGTDLTQLMGWAEILKALAYDPKDRASRDRVKKLNAGANGPIKSNGKRGVIVNQGALLHWWRTVADQADSSAMKRRQIDRDDRVKQDVLQNAGERRDRGMHEKGRPNTRRRR